MTDNDPTFSLGFEDPGAAYVSGSQRARVFTESWVAAYLFCPACGAGRVSRRPNNVPVGDFSCAACREEFELKSKKGRLGPKVADGAYGAKMARLRFSVIRFDDDAVAVDDHQGVAGPFDREPQIGVGLLVPPLGVCERTGQHAADRRLHGLD